MSNFPSGTHFQDLAAQDPQNVCQRALCRYDNAEKAYRLSVWGDTFKIFPHQGKIVGENQNRPPLHEYFSLFMVHYLTNAKAIEPAGEWISEKDLPGGPTFFRGPHEIPTGLITQRFGDDIGPFKKTCNAQNGTEFSMADATYRFEITARIPVAVLYWQGDEDFPAEARLLFDKTIVAHLALDIVWALAVGVCEELGKNRLV